MIVTIYLRFQAQQFYHCIENRKSQKIIKQIVIITNSDRYLTHLSSNIETFECKLYTAVLRKYSSLLNSTLQWDGNKSSMDPIQSHRGLNNRNFTVLIKSSSKYESQSKDSVPISSEVIGFSPDPAPISMSMREIVCYII